MAWLAATGRSYDSHDCRLRLGWNALMLFSSQEIFALFGRSLEETRRISCVNSEEYLNILIYLVGRDEAER